MFTNGLKKAEGTYLNNQKIGTWNIWDTTGKLISQREYKNSFDFKIIIHIQKRKLKITQESKNII